MTALEAVRRVHRRVVAAPEAGTTMVEVIVAMIIMTICGAIFTGAMVTLVRASDAAQAATNTAQQTNQAYQSLDKMVRYASSITSPGLGTGTGDWYVELSDTTSGTEVCTQLRLDKTTKVLQQRSWTPPAVPADKDWRALGSTYSNASAAKGDKLQPFVLLSPGPTSTHQQVTFNLVAQAGPTSNAHTSTSSFTLSALNSGTQPATSSGCQQVTRP